MRDNHSIVPYFLQIMVAQTEPAINPAMMMPMDIISVTLLVKLKYKAAAINAKIKVVPNAIWHHPIISKINLAPLI